jgi:hypothetical protein
MRLVSAAFGASFPFSHKFWEHRCMLVSVCFHNLVTFENIGACWFLCATYTQRLQDLTDMWIWLIEWLIRWLYMYDALPVLMCHILRWDWSVHPLAHCTHFLFWEILMYAGVCMFPQSCDLRTETAGSLWCVLDVLNVYTHLTSVYCLMQRTFA